MLRSHVSPLSRAEARTNRQILSTRRVSACSILPLTRFRWRVLPARLTASGFDRPARIGLAPVRLRDNPAYHLEHSTTHVRFRDPDRPNGPPFITTALENGAQLEDVQKAASHRDSSTTKLHDRRGYNPERAANASTGAWHVDSLDKDRKGSGVTDKGAHFFRCDLQLHSPRDQHWAGADRIDDADRRAYAAQLVQACRERGLQGIAITDHHDMAFVEYVRRAADDETDQAGKPLAKEQRLAVFPGMELTLSVPCQALLLFDADFPVDMFLLATTALAINFAPATDAKTAETGRLTHIQSLRQLKDELDKHTCLRDRYIIFPNIGENSQFSLLRKGQAAKYAEMPCVGGYVDGELSKLEQGNQNIVDGKTKEWGNKRIAIFQTSDNRCEDHRNLGRVSTWVKWAVPSAEALRQACLAQESRVSQDTPRLPSVAVASISVSNSAFLGPIDLELNPQYNALIGGRGTGKSTILEYLRWTLCDQPPTISDEDTPNYQARRSRLIDQNSQAGRCHGSGPV